jgi:ABC-2 type transport system permease protein
MSTESLEPADLRWRLRQSDLNAVAALLMLTLRQHLRGKRLLVLSLLFLLPSVLAGVVPLLKHAPPPEVLEFAFVFNLIPHALAPLTALLYAGGIIQDEIEEQTLTYLLTRPVPRWAVYLAKLAMTVVATSVLTGVFTTLTLTVIYWNTEQLWGEVLPDRAVKIASLLALTQAAYCSLFAAVSLLLRRSMIVGLIYIVVFEGLLASFPTVARLLTVMYYFRVLSARWLEPAGIQEWSLDLATAPSNVRCVLTLAATSLVLALLGAVLMMRREFRVKTPEGS